MNLIEKKEYRKRRREYIKKHVQILQEILDLSFENKVSLGTIVERSAEKYSDNIAVKFEDILKK